MELSSTAFVQGGDMGRRYSCEGEDILPPLSWRGLPTGTKTLALIVDRKLAKGDVLEVARLAGIMGAKRTSELIPLCHPLPLTKAEVEIGVDSDLPGLFVRATVKVTGSTGVEMEALTAVSVACLTIYDMVKSVERGMRIEGIRLLEKTGGKSGSWRAD